MSSWILLLALSIGAGILVLIVVTSMRGEAERQRFQRNAERCAAEVLSFTAGDSGTRAGKTSALRVRFVDGPHAGTESSFEQFIPFLSAAAVQPGRTVKMFVSRESPPRCLIDWSAMGYEGQA